MTKVYQSEPSDEEEDQLMRPASPENDSIQDIRYMLGFSDFQDQNQDQDSSILDEKPQKKLSYNSINSSTKQIINPISLSSDQDSDECQNEISGQKTIIKSSRKSQKSQIIEPKSRRYISLDEPIETKIRVPKIKRIKRQTLTKSQPNSTVQFCVRNQSRQTKQINPKKSTLFKTRSTRHQTQFDSKKSHLSKEEQPLQNQSIQQPDSKNQLDLQKKNDKIQEDQKEILNKNEKKRKIRSTITKEKLEKLIRLFKCYKKNIPYKGVLIPSLKYVGQMLKISYSTTLHKYRQFKTTERVEEGVLIKYKNQKRLYNKSNVIRNHIKNALKLKDFRGCKELGDFIAEQWGCTLSRSIVSRQLNMMRQEKKKQEIKKGEQKDQN